MVPLSYIKQIGSFFDNMKEYTNKLVIGSSFIVSNKTIRTLLGTFFLIYKTIKPMKFTENFEQSTKFFNSIKMGDIMNTSELIS